LVAKKPNSVYESGRRSGAWVKFKITKSQEFVICGYMLPEGGRKYFGSLRVGYQDPDGLVFAGRVGTGFSDKVLANLYAKFQKLRLPTCPFVNLPEKSKGRWGHYTGGHETLRLGQTRARGSGQIHRVDARWPASSGGLSRAANRQGGKGCRSRINREIAPPNGCSASKL
jgi:hypothetical protein